MKRAKLIKWDKVRFENGAIMEIKLWKIPRSETKPHGCKYSLVYIEKGKRVVGYDNAESKGDHKHYGNKEEQYNFKNIDKLVKDFTRDVEKIRGEKIR